MNYYNDNDPFCAQWLRNLIDANLIGDGIVTERDIRKISGVGLGEYARCHWFAGIAGWELALNLAGWPADRPVWTGSCPCQPFSVAGKGQAEDDSRHLWPAWFRIIRECHPPTIFGEQVPGAIGHGWLDRVFNDLESEGYACGAAVLPACSVGAPHNRARLFWVADSGNGQLPHEGRRQERRSGIGSPSEDGGLAEPTAIGWGRRDYGDSSGRIREVQTEGRGSANAWSDFEWLPCTDGKWRRTQSGIHTLAARLPGRVGQLRAYGNSIVPALASEFIMAFIEAERP